MGTNYYFIKQEGEACPHCHRGASETRTHIGKSSMGWCFGLHVIPDEKISSLEDWKKLFPLGKIEDENGSAVTTEVMLATITERKWTHKNEPYGYESWDQFHRQNHSCEGPSGLVRHNYPGNLYAHGDGTWDCLLGEFS